MTALTFNPRSRLTIQQARRLARSIQSPADVSALIATAEERERAARLVDELDYDVSPGAVLDRTPRRRASSWFAPVALLAVLAVVAMVYVVAMVPR